MCLCHNVSRIERRLVWIFLRAQWCSENIRKLESWVTRPTRRGIKSTSATWPYPAVLCPKAPSSSRPCICPGPAPQLGHSHWKPSETIRNDILLQVLNKLRKKKTCIISSSRLFWILACQLRDSSGFIMSPIFSTTPHGFWLDGAPPWSPTNISSPTSLSRKMTSSLPQILRLATGRLATGSPSDGTSQLRPSGYQTDSLSMAICLPWLSWNWLIDVPHNERCNVHLSRML